MSQWWGWVLGILGTCGNFYVGHKKIWAWGILICNECLWITYSVLAKQYGLIVFCISYIAVYVRNIKKWSSEDLVLDNHIDNNVEYHGGWGKKRDW